MQMKKQKIIKYLNNKNLLRINSYFIFIVFFFSMVSCKKDEPDCGCDSQTVFTINESDEQIGYLYKYIDDDNENVPPHNYDIYFSDTSCINCLHTFIICNDVLLNSLDIIPTYPGIEVKFAGEVKKLCKQITAPADYTYNYITLTNIEIQ